MRYFFDTRIDGRLSRDDVGIELPTLARAKEEAEQGLADLAKDELPRIASGTISITVRTESGEEVFAKMISVSELR
jgi:hypothetical protein